MTKRAAVIDATGAAVPDNVDRRAINEMARQRRRLVYRLAQQGYDETHIAQAITAQYQEQGIHRVITPSIVRRDIEIMRGVVRGQVIKSDPFTEVGGHTQFFEEMCKMASQVAIATDDIKCKAEMMRVAMAARKSLIDLQLETGIIDRAGPRGGKTVPTPDGKDVDLREMSLEQLMDLGELMREDPAVQKALTDAGGGVDDDGDDE